MAETWGYLSGAMGPMLLSARISQRRSMYIDRYLIASRPIAVAAGALMCAALWSGWPILLKFDWSPAIREVAGTCALAALLLVEGPTEREGILYPGDLHITTCPYNQECLEDDGGKLAVTVVPLPFELLSRAPAKPKHERELEELGRAKTLVDTKIVLNTGRVFVAITVDPFDFSDEESIIERMPEYQRWKAERGIPQVTRFQRLRLLRFDAR